MKPSLSRSPKPVVILPFQPSPPPSACGLVTRPVIVVSLTSSFKIKFTTPAIASEPYKADAPSVNTSTRAIALNGIELRSTVLPEPRGAKRRPFNNTKV